MGKNPRLQPREAQIADLLCKGLKSDEIADALGVSSKTVKNNLIVMYRLFGARNRVEFCMMWKDIA